MEPFRENFAMRWKSTPALWRAAMLFGIAGLTVTLFLRPVDHPGLIVAGLRTVFALLAFVAIVVNKRVADDFYARVYAEASVVAIVLSAIVFFARSPWAFGGGVSSLAALSTLIVTWWLGFALSFLRLRNS